MCVTCVMSVRRVVVGMRAACWCVCVLNLCGVVINDACGDRGAASLFPLFPFPLFFAPALIPFPACPALILSPRIPRSSLCASALFSCAQDMVYVNPQPSTLNPKP